MRMPPLILVIFATACAHRGGTDADAPAHRADCQGLTPQVRKEMTAAGEFDDRGERCQPPP